MKLLLSAFLGVVCFLGVLLYPTANYGLTTEYKLLFQWSFPLGDNFDKFTRFEFFVITEGNTEPVLIGTIEDINAIAGKVVASIPSGKHTFIMRAASDTKVSLDSPPLPFELVTKLNGFRRLIKNS